MIKRNKEEAQIMNSKGRERVYEDFEPTSNWVHGKESDTLVLLLSGFRREEMKVQITSTYILKVSDEQKIEDKRLVRRFYKEFSVPRDINIDQIGAKFEDGKLYNKFPQVMTKPPTREEEAVSKAEAEKASQKKKEKKEGEKKKEEKDEAINVGLLTKHKKVCKMIVLIVALLLVLVIGIRVRNKAMEDSSSLIGRSEVQELYVDV